MATRETPGFFNKFLYNSISERLGRKNEYLNTATLGADCKRLRHYYENRGFSDVVVDTSLTFDEGASAVDVTIRITEGYRSLIDSLLYLGIVDAPGTIWADILGSPKITAGDPFNGQLLEEEVHPGPEDPLERGVPECPLRAGQFMGPTLCEHAELQGAAQVRPREDVLLRPGHDPAGNRYPAGPGDTRGHHR